MATNTDDAGQNQGSVLQFAKSRLSIHENTLGVLQNGKFHRQSTFVFAMLRSIEPAADEDISGDDLNAIFMRITRQADGRVG